MAYFNPINASDGIQEFLPAAEVGWHQMPGPSSVLPEVPNLTLPADAQGVWIQARGGTLTYCMSPEATNLLSVGMTLADGESRFVPGAIAMRSLCFLLDGTVGFVLQFYTGDIGPTPTVS